MFSGLLLVFLAASAAATWPSRPWSQRGFYPTQYGSVHYVYSGNFSSAAPALVFFHMNPGSTANFEQTIDLLHTDFPFVAFDFFGQGHSDDDPRYNSTDIDINFVNASEFADFALAVLDELKAERFVLVGALSGTATSLAIAEAVPHRLDAIVLINPMWYFKDVAKSVRKCVQMLRLACIWLAHVLHAWLRAHAYA